MSILHTIRFILNHPLNQNNKIKALARFVKWQIGSRLIPGRVFFEWINQTNIVVQAGEVGLTGNIYCGLDEFEEMGYLLHVVRQEDVFFDVGANVGSYTILACGATGAKGYSFEPVPTTYHRLCENVMINNLQGRVNCYNVGLGEKKETLRFTANQDSTNHAVIDNLSVTQTSDGIIAGNDQPITSQITQTLIPV